MSNVYKMNKDDNITINKESNVYTIEKKPKERLPQPSNTPQKDLQPVPSMWDYLVSWFY